MYTRSLWQLANKYQAQQCFSSDEDSEEGFKPPGLSAVAPQAQSQSNGQNSTPSDQQMGQQQQCSQDCGSKLLHRFTSDETRDDESLSKAETETLVKLLKVYQSAGTNEKLCEEDYVSRSYEGQSSQKTCPSFDNQNQQQTIWRQLSSEEAQPNCQQAAGGKNGFQSALFITPPKVDHNVASSVQIEIEDASSQTRGIKETVLCDTLVNSDRISVSPFQNTKQLANAQARQALHLTEQVKVREPFADTFEHNKSPYQAPKEWIVKKEQDLNLKSATSGIIDEKLGSAVPCTTASSNSLFKSSSGPRRYKHDSNSQNLSATSNNASQGQACESAPHQFLGKDLVSLLDSCQSPLKEITDFDATQKNKQESTQPSFQSFQLNKITIGNPIQAQPKAVEEKADLTFAFPDGGWVCSSCQNYNFSGRCKCNRCQKQKAKNDFVGKPKHLLRQQRQVEQKAQAVKPDQTNGNQKVQAPTSALVATNSTQGKENKLNEERVGDWVCMKCANLNFSFRMTCNRCFRDRTAGASVIKNQDELQKFQSAGCPAQYIRTHTSGLNSHAASFKPCSSDQPSEANLPTEAKIIGAMSVQDRSQVESILRRLSNQSEVSQSGGNEPDAEQEEQLFSE